MPNQTVLSVVYQVGKFEEPHQDFYGLTYGISVKSKEDAIYIPKVGAALALRRFDKRPIRFTGQVREVFTDNLQETIARLNTRVVYSVYDNLIQGKLVDLFGSNSETKEDVLNLCSRFYLEGIRCM